jgi:hypothetical protein
MSVCHSCRAPRQRTAPVPPRERPLPRNLCSAAVQPAVSSSSTRNWSRCLPSALARRVIERLSVGPARAHAHARAAWPVVAERDEHNSAGGPGRGQHCSTALISPGRRRRRSAPARRVRGRTLPGGCAARADGRAGAHTGGLRDPADRVRSAALRVLHAVHEGGVLGEALQSLPTDGGHSRSLASQAIINLRKRSSLPSWPMH